MPNGSKQRRQVAASNLSHMIFPLYPVVSSVATHRWRILGLHTSLSCAVKAAISKRLPEWGKIRPFLDVRLIVGLTNSRTQARHHSGSPFIHLRYGTICGTPGNKSELRDLRAKGLWKMCAT